MPEFTHFNQQGRAHMVDISEKLPSARSAVAVGRVCMCEETIRCIQQQQVKKGDVLAVAQVAGIMAAKRTWETIPMCPAIPLSAVDLSFSFADWGIALRAEVKCHASTGAEMEALSAVSAAALTIYDMCKALQRDMVISDIHLLEKHGGKSGTFCWEVSHG